MFLRTVISIVSFLLIVSVRAEVNGFGDEWSDSTMVLGEISVTAIKNVGSVDKSASSVTDIPYETIEKLDIKNVKQAASIVPNFYIPDYGSRMTSSIYVRGIGARIDQPAVGLNVDNVPFLNKDNYDFDLPDIERIEIYRGPQTTLYGRNTMAGLVNVYTLSPLKYKGLRASVSYGSGAAVNVSAGAYFKLSNIAGMSFSGGFYRQNGFFENEFNGKKADGERNGSMRWKTSWRLTDGVMLENSAAFSINRQGGYPYQSVETGKIAYNDTCFYRRTGVSDGLTLNVVLPNVTLSSISSFQYIKDNMTLDQDFLPMSYFTLSQKRHEWAFTQDLLAKGTINRYHWLGGLFGFYKRGNMQAPVTFKNDGIKQLIENHVNRPGDRYEIRFDERAFVLNSDFLLPVSGVAVYHRSTCDFERFSVSADLRLDYENAKIDYHNYMLSSYTQWDITSLQERPYQKVPINIDDHGFLQQNFLQFIPKISVEYKLNRGALYLTFGKGYKSGGFNTQMFSDVLQQALMGFFGLSQAYDVDKIITYKPEKSWNYEVGAHLSFPEYKLTGSMAVFYIDCRDQQLTMFPPGVTTGRIMTNAGQTRSMGAEISVKWSPIRNLMFNVAYGYTNARFVKFNDGVGDYKDKRVPYAPANTLYASADYKLSAKKPWLSVVESVSFYAGLRGVGDIYWNESNMLKQPFYVQLDGVVSAELKGGFTLDFSLDNFTNTQYDVFYFKSIGNEFLQRGKPCRFELRMRYSF